MWYILLLLGYKPVQHVTTLNTVGNCNTMASIIILYYNIKILWDHRRKCGPSLTETSLCGTWLYFKSRNTHQIIPRNSTDVKKEVESYQRILQINFHYAGCFCFWICMGIIGSKTDCRKSAFNVCTSHHLLLRWGNSWCNQEKNKWRFLFILFFLFVFVFICLIVCFFFLCLKVQQVRFDCS